MVWDIEVICFHEGLGAFVQLDSWGEVGLLVSEFPVMFQMSS